jgi:uncharacterized protein (DUF2062 family)
MLIKNPFKSFKALFSLKDEPKVIAKGFALGSFIGMLPILGFQLIVSLGNATLFNSTIFKAGFDVFLSIMVGGILTGLFAYAIT